MRISTTTRGGTGTSTSTRPARMWKARARVRPARPARSRRPRETRAQRAHPARIPRAPATLLGLALGCGLVLLACAGPAGDPDRDRAAADSANAAQQPADARPDATDAAAPADARGDEVAAPPADEAEDTSGAPGPWVDPPVSAEHAVAGAATLASVRTARHDGYDRIVFDFGDRPLPSWRVSYLAGPATHCGSGETVPLDAPATLEIAFQPAHAHTEQGQATVQARDRTLGLPALRRLVLTCDFEAHVDWAAAIEGTRPIRVLELAAPSRLVVDVRHPPG